LQTDNKVTDRK